MSNIVRLLQGLAAERISRPDAGQGLHDAFGFQGVNQNERWLFALITAGPSASGAYSWVEMLPLPQGTSGTGDSGLSGTGGTGSILYNPAYAWGGAIFAAGDQVILLRGYQYGESTLIDDYPGGSGGTGPIEDIGQEWLIVTGAGGSGSDVQHIRVDGAPQWGEDGPSCEFFPGFLQSFDVETCSHSDGVAVWLKQAVGAPLGNDGNSIYTGLFRGTFQACGATAGRAVYVTTERIYVVDVECASTGGTGMIVTYNGRYTPFLHSHDHEDCRNTQFALFNGVFQI